MIFAQVARMTFLKVHLGEFKESAFRGRHVIPGEASP
jgi:hypothetical protein